MTNFYTADLHIGHKRIIELCQRPFDDVDHMNRAFLFRWNEVVGPDDNVYILGDLALGTVSESLHIVEELAGNKFLIPGNHDRCHSGIGQAEKRYMYEDVGLTVLPEITRVPFFNDSLLACHFPYAGDSREVERYAQYRPVDNGEILLHGHVHNAWHVNGHQVNVGVDVNAFRPVSEMQLDGLFWDRGLLVTDRLKHWSDWE